VTDGVITRPKTAFDGPTHVYRDEEGQRLYGVSSAAKIGEAEDSFSIGCAWGFGLGVAGAYELASTNGRLRPFDVEFPSKDGPKTVRVEDAGSLREAMQGRGLTPWSVRDQAANRGNWAHDLLEALATDGSTAKALETVSDEYRGHGRAILQWFLDYRPDFVATEVQVTSTTHAFAGRYDIRCKIKAKRLLAVARYWLAEDHPVRRLVEVAAELDLWLLCLVDLKTSKRIYPTSHFAQLEGYELASVGMGFPPTDVRLVLNTHPDGTYDVGVSYSTGEDFLAYLEALKAIKGLKDKDPEVRRKRAMEAAILALLPAVSRDVAGQPGCPDTAQEVGRVLGGLRKRGLVEQDPDKTWRQSS
jgi:hypothetical protein